MNRSRSLLSLLVLAVVAISGAGPRAQSQLPRNAFGQPDLEGVWNFSSDVPLERTKEFADKKFFTREELERHKIARDKNLDELAKLAPVEVVDRLWLDYGAHADNLRTSLVVYPENGRLPPLVAGVQRVGGLATFLTDFKGTRPVRFLVGGISKDAPQDRGLSERCLVGTGTNPPFAPGFENNYVEILQSKDHVVLRADAARVVPLDGRPHLGDRMRSWSGDSRGHWEGDTLVVETRNFNGLAQSFSAAGTSYDKVVIERFTRVSASALEYEATVVDPKTFQDKIVLSFPMAKADTHIYEAACHEGNYSMAGILSGARKEEEGAK